MNALRTLCQCVAACILSMGVANAQRVDFPSKPVRIIIPAGAGGTSDGVGRLIAARLSQRWGQPVVVENKPGAGGNIGSEFVAKSPADGYTILLGSVGTSALNGAMYKNLTYSPERDLVPVTGVATVPFMIVGSPQLRARNLQELVALAKTRTLSYGSAGVGTVNHLAGELLGARAKIRLTHVPYKSAVQSVTDTMSGHIDINIGSLVTSLTQAKAGLVTPLVVLTPARVPSLPDVPTAAESGYPDLNVHAWFGLFVPVGTPRALMQRIHDDTTEAMRPKEEQDKLVAMGAEPMTLTLEGFRDMVDGDIRKWGKVARDAGITAD